MADAADARPKAPRSPSYRTKSGVDRTFWGNTQLALQYVGANTRRAPRSLVVGIATVALVVGFAALLQSVVQRSPLIFMRLQEDQTGDADMVLTPETSADSASPFLNASEISHILRNNPHVIGAAPRWLLLGSVLRQDEPLVNTSAWILIIDSEKEAEIGIGRNWGRRRLGEQETYVSETVLLDLGVKANNGERVRLYIDPIAFLSGLGVGGFGAGGGDLDDPLVAQELLEGVGGVDLETSLQLDLDILAAAVAAALGTPVFTGLGTVPVDLSGAFQALYPAIRDALVIDEELIVVDGVDDPGGKWAPILGNVLVLEMDYAAQLIREALDAALAVLEGLQIGVLPGILGGLTGGAVGPAGLTDFLISARLFIDSIDKTMLYDNALMVNVQYTNRAAAYQMDEAGLKKEMVTFSNAVFDDLGPLYPAAPELPLATALQGTIFIRLFLDQIFNAVVFLLGVLGVMVIYSLVIGDVEEKTYEYGMLRALGMRHGLLAQVLAVQSTAFSLPGLVAGFVVAAALNVIVMVVLADFLIIDVAEVPLGLHTSAVVYALVLGTVMPAIANIIPVRRALSKTLRDALDMYHQTSNAVQVTMQRLADVGLSAPQIALSAMLVVIGFVTYTLLPLAFIFRDFSLFLSILNGILLGMVLGLSLVSQALQSALENGVLWSMLWGAERRMQTVVRRNLAGHRHRNRKTAYMISISVAFLLFGGTMFALQSTSIANTVQLIVGADVLVWSLSSSTPVPQEDMTRVLDGFVKPTGGRAPIVDGYTYITYQMTSANFVRRTRLGNLAAVPEARCQLYGVQSNFEDVAFEKYFITSESVPVEASPLRTDAENDAVNAGPFAALYGGAGQLRLPIEGAGAAPPFPVVAGAKPRPRYVCNISSIPGVAPEDAWVPDGGTDGMGGPSPAAYAAVMRAVDDGDVDLYQWGFFCFPECGVPCQEVPAVNFTRLREVVNDAYVDYVDVIMSEATREFSSTDTTTPLKMRIEARDPSTGDTRNSVYLAKARAMMAKAPGFFFSTYSQTGGNAPVLVTMETFGRLLLQAEADAAAASGGGDGDNAGGGGGGGGRADARRPAAPDAASTSGAVSRASRPRSMFSTSFRLVTASMASERSRNAVNSRIAFSRTLSISCESSGYTTSRTGPTMKRGRW
uniref:ABC3 transporter permease C-terminal domain-containing protein n=1 Tax=Bicosoecida sp. CB-2014 TaxID=1486930 RepID=A0A6T6YUC0_9STRA